MKSIICRAEIRFLRVRGWIWRVVVNMCQEQMEETIITERGWPHSTLCQPATRPDWRCWCSSTTSWARRTWPGSSPPSSPSSASTSSSRSLHHLLQQASLSISGSCLCPSCYWPWQLLEGELDLDVDMWSIKSINKCLGLDQICSSCFSSRSQSAALFLSSSPSSMISPPLSTPSQMWKSTPSRISSLVYHLF